MVQSIEFVNKLDFAYKMRQRVICARKKKTEANVSTEMPGAAADPTVLPTPSCGIYCHDLVTQLYMLTCQIQGSFRNSWTRAPEN